MTTELSLDMESVRLVIENLIRESNIVAARYHEALGVMERYEVGGREIVVVDDHDDNISEMTVPGVSGEYLLVDNAIVQRFRINGDEAYIFDCADVDGFCDAVSDLEDAITDAEDMFPDLATFGRSR